MKNNRYILMILMLLLLIVILTGCQESDKENTGTTFLMDTVVQMKVYGNNGDEIIDESFARLKEIEDEMSKTIEDSDIYHINSNAGKDYVVIGEDTYRVIEKALQYAEMTAGKFDPSIGPLVELWGIGTDHARVPSPEEIKQTMSLVNYKWVKMNPDNHSVKLEKEGMKLDLGAIVKGYAADEVRNILEAEGVKSAFINLGGNVLVVGGKPDGSPWKVGIQDPRQNRGNVMAGIKVKDKTVVTSGNYERYFEKDGVIYHHIIDPTTGSPARTGIMSASIISNDSFDADALSTSVFILGKKKGIELVNKLEGVEAVIIGKDLGIIMSDGLKDKVEIMDDDFHISGK